MWTSTAANNFNGGTQHNPELCSQHTQPHSNMNEASFIKINAKDTVVVCLRPPLGGATIEVVGKKVW